MSGKRLAVIAAMAFSVAVPIGIVAAVASDEPSRDSSGAATEDVQPGEVEAAIKEAEAQANAAFEQAGKPAPHGVYVLPDDVPDALVTACSDQLANGRSGTEGPTDFECRAFIALSKGELRSGTYTPDELRTAVDDPTIGDQ